MTPTVTIQDVRDRLAENIDTALELKIGTELARVLCLRRDPEHKDRWQTTGGNKRDLGIYRTIVAIITDEIEKSEKENP